MFKGWNRKEKHMCLTWLQFRSKCYDVATHYHTETEKWYCARHFPPNVEARRLLKISNAIAREKRKKLAKAEKRKKTHKIHLLVKEDGNKLVMGCGV